MPNERYCHSRIKIYRRTLSRWALAVILLTALLLSCVREKSPSAGLVILNEVSCHKGDWVEIVNVSDDVQDISSWYIADHLFKDGHQYPLPDGTEIQPGEHLVVNKAENTTEEGFPFGLSCDNQESTYLLDSDKDIVDKVLIGPVDYGNSWGRLPDRTGVWRQTAQTPGEENAPPLAGLTSED
jgi:hypothetical protein